MPARVWPVAAFLVLVPLVCWAWIVVLSRDMYGPMTGASVWMMTPVWDARHLLLLWAMWAVMMTGMMLPSAAPMVMLAGDGARPYFLALGYVSIWIGFSVGATALQWLLMRTLILTPMMEVSGATAGATLLAIAGIYQWTPLKSACLTTCQSPMAFITPPANSNSISAQQQPTQKKPCSAPIRKAPMLPLRHRRVTKAMGDWHVVRHARFSGVH